MALMKYYGGPMIPNAEIVSIYLNVTLTATPPPGIGQGQYFTGDWQSDPMLQALSAELDSFLSFIVGSEYFDPLAEYSATGSDGVERTIGRATWIGSHYLSFEAGPKNLNEFAPTHDEIHTWFYDMFARSLLPLPNPPNRCYLIFLPPGVSLSPATWGYHNALDPWADYPNLPYAVVMHSDPGVRYSPPPYTTTQPLSYQLDTLTVRTTHELVEMITDASPIRLPAWQSSVPLGSTGNIGEIADVCERPVHDFEFHGYRVSSFWSDTRQQCIGCNARIQLAEGGTCLGDIVEHQVATFSVALSCTLNEPVAYHWSVTGAQPVPLPSVLHPSSGRPSPLGHESSFAVKASAAPATITVKVTVTDTKDRTPTSATATYRVVTAQQAAQQAEFCALIERMRTDVKVNLFPNPLWDPIRGDSPAAATVAPITEHDVRTLHEAALRLAQQTETLVGLHGALMSGAAPMLPSAPSAASTYPAAPRTSRGFFGNILATVGAFFRRIFGNSATTR